MNRIDVEIQCVKCHPRLPNCFFVLLRDGTFLHYNPFTQKKPLREVSFSLSGFPSVLPISFSFGCKKDCDQFALYISYSNGFIGLLNPLPIEGYSLSKEEFSSLWKESPQAIRDWLGTWNIGDRMNYQPSAKSSDIIILNREISSTSIESSEITVYDNLFLIVI